MSKASCTQPGCKGTIEDGYCDACGMAAAQPQNPSTPKGASPKGTVRAAVAPPPSAPSGKAACAQPGCNGTIEDGYCDTCGMAAAPSSSHSTRSTTSSSRTGSNKLPMSRSARSARSTRSTRSTRSVRSTRSSRSTTRGFTNKPLARPALAPLDPLAAIVPGVVPERKRFCSNCDVALKREAGFCPKCGQEYSFVPTLSPGDMVADKYEIKGTLAFGGLGWIYLALDTVLTRWVILKGLLNAKDPRMLEVAVSEREFLAAVKHPNIVAIYDFITHGSQGFIVMEYVNGKTLMTLRKEQSGEPLPVAEAISYVLEILPAFDHLDQLGLVYCDMKPENVMVEEETVKLIDMGAVRQAEATGGDIYGSRGYSAPEASQSPSPISDLYSVARTLAVLVANFDFQGKYEHALPSPDECPAFREHDALYRFLQKATREKPEERFQSAEEMAEQLLGVLRTVTAGALDLGPSDSVLFSNDGDRISDVDGRAPISDSMPRLKVDQSDPAAGIVLASGSVPDPSRRIAMYERARKQFPGSLELVMRIADEHAKAQNFDAAMLALEEARQKAEPGDLRPLYYRGRVLLAQGRTSEVIAAFEAIASELPGDLPSRFLLGHAFEAAGEIDRAIAVYDLVSRADASLVSASIRLARCLTKKGDTKAAAEAYRRVPPTSSRFVEAELAIAALLVRPLLERKTSSVDEALQQVREAAAALEAIEGLGDSVTVRTRRADVLEAAALTAARGATMGDTLLGRTFDQRSLRFGAEAELRAAAKRAEGSIERVALVDRANEVRPYTWL